MVLSWGGLTAKGGWSVTGVAYLYSFIPLAGDLGDLMLTGHAVIGNAREVAARAGLAAPVIPDGSGREGRACGSWRLDGR
jgi:hypothetical protein